MMRWGRASRFGGGLLLLALVGFPVSSQASEGRSSPARCVVSQADRPLDAAEQATLVAINAYRESKGLGIVVASAGLRRAAMWKADALAQGAPLEHDDPGRTWDQRLNDCGYDLNAEKGENLARYSGVMDDETEAREIVAAWIASPTHEAVQANAAFRVIGIARVRVTDPATGVTRTGWAATYGSIPDDERPAE